MKDDICNVKVGFHVPPYYEDKDIGLVVCSRHKAECEESQELGPYKWEEYDASKKQM